MIHEISILIPTRNDVCLNQVIEIQHLASKIPNLQYEIIVSDDASTNQEALKENARINDLEHCSLLLRHENAGRSANRNFLASKARYEWLLFLDCNIRISNECFLANYLESDSADVVNGGMVVEKNNSLLHSNLRYMYETKMAQKHSATKRSEHPYQSFRTSNFMVRREVMRNFPLDESIFGYGYEDVLWGKTLHDNDISINHIDNPVAMCQFEDNPRYVSKIEEAMRTLYGLHDELSGYSPLLSTVETLRKFRLTQPFKQFFKRNSQRIRMNLVGPTPSQKWINIYKLGYYLSFEDGTHK